MCSVLHQPPPCREARQVWGEVPTDTPRHPAALPERRPLDVPSGPCSRKDLQPAGRGRGALVIADLYLNFHLCGELRKVAGRKEKISQETGFQRALTDPKSGAQPPAGAGWLTPYVCIKGGGGI